VIESPRLRLVPLTRADASELFPVLDDPRLHRYTGGRPLDEQALTKRFSRLERGTSGDGGEIWANWVVRLREAGTAIGFVQASIGAERAKVAWVIGQAWQGSGYASEAARAMTAWLRGAGVTSVRAHIHPENEASARVAASAGLRSTHSLDAGGELIWEAPAAGSERG
jgi:RimJ/RimL family protein N-acetyltransferase